MLPFAALPLLLLASVAQEEDPTPLPQTQSWRITSFLEDAKLADRVVFDFTFQDDGTIWVAASDGLYRSHGYVWHHYTTDEWFIVHQCRWWIEKMFAEPDKSPLRLVK